MTKQMTAQEMAVELKKNPLHTEVKFWKRLNTITVEFNEDAETGPAVEAALEKLGFEMRGYGMARYDGQRINLNPISQEDKDRAASNFRSSTGASYLFKN